MLKLINFISATFSDPWILFGFLAQFVFFLRFFVQWIVSEKHKRTVIPMSFWYLSVVGSLMILIYSIKRGDIVFITASCLNTFIYIRNIMIAKKPSEKKKRYSGKLTKEI